MKEILKNDVINFVHLLGRFNFIPLLLVLTFFNSNQVFALQSSSPHYGVNEVQFGAGGLLNATSPSYEAQESLGSTTVGSASSPSYWAKLGYLTPNTPFLQVTVSGSNVNLGNLSTSTTAAGTATFNVLA